MKEHFVIEQITFEQNAPSPKTDVKGDVEAKTLGTSGAHDINRLPPEFRNFLAKVKWLNP